MQGYWTNLSIAAAAALLALCFTSVQAQADPYTISGPLNQSNLAIYPIHGTSKKLPTPMTLEEALTQKLVRVIETGTVNELAIENLGTQAIFIQAGDIVTGGKQDRLLAASLLLPPRSGRLAIAAFCVESGRWSPRPGHDEAVFSAAHTALSSRGAKVLMYQSLASVAAQEMPSRFSMQLSGSPQAYRQAAMWAEAKTVQDNLSNSLHSSARDTRSPTSLGLTLDSDKLKAREKEFVDALSAQMLRDNDVIGMVVAINGRISSAELYATNALFRKMAPKMLRAAADEAIRLSDQSQAERPSPAEVQTFLRSAEAGDIAQRKEAAANIIETNETEHALSITTKRDDGLLVSKSYVVR